MARRALLGLVALSGVNAALGIYPDGHFDHVTKLTTANFDSVVKAEVDAGRTFFVRWIASAGVFPVAFHAFVRLFCAAHAERIAALLFRRWTSQPLCVRRCAGEQKMHIVSPWDSARVVHTAGVHFPPTTYQHQCLRRGAGWGAQDEADDESRLLRYVRPPLDTVPRHGGLPSAREGPPRCS
jgi:hypothetical protein